MNTIQSVPFLPKPEFTAAIQAPGERLDGRSTEEFRPSFMQVGVISRAAGSAYAEIGQTKLMVAVYGPRPSDRKVGFSESGRLQVDVKLASFATRARGRVQQTPQEREFSALACAALEKAVLLESFPKAIVDVYACVLEAGGNELAAVISTASLALADARLEMRDLVAACSLSRVDDALLLDPTPEEAHRQQASALLAHMPLANLVTQLVMTGEWSLAASRDALGLAMGACAQLDVVMRDALRASAEA